MRYELKSIPLWPVAKVGFFVNLVVGFLLGMMYAVFLIPIVALLSNVAAFEAGEFDIQAAPIGVMMMIVPFFMALSSAFFGTLGIVIVVLVYNFIARMTGGLELDLEQLGLHTAAPVHSSPAPMATAAPPTVPPPPPPLTSAREQSPATSPAVPTQPAPESTPPAPESHGQATDRTDDEHPTL